MKIIRFPGVKKVPFRSLQIGDFFEDCDGDVNVKFSYEEDEDNAMWFNEGQEANRRCMELLVEVVPLNINLVEEQKS